jgi:hypothetical protein
MDTTQIIVIFSLLSVTMVIIIAGIWLILVLRELRDGIKKTNILLDDAKLVASSISRPVSSFSEFLMGFKNGFKLFNTFFREKKTSHG